MGVKRSPKDAMKFEPLSLEKTNSGGNPGLSRSRLLEVCGARFWKAYRLVYHSTLGLRVKKKKKKEECALD